MNNPKKPSGAYCKVGNLKDPMEYVNFKSDEAYEIVVRAFFKYEKDRENLPEILKSATTPDEAINSIRRYCDSYELLPTLLNNHSSMNGDLWLDVLGQLWSTFDNVWEHKEQLLSIFQGLNRKELNLMMDSNELIELGKLPEIINIYRGCYEVNRIGLSWTTSQKVAKEFTTLNRYKIDGEPPLLLKARLPKSHAILKLDRDEFEVIATDLTLLEYLS